MALIPQGGELGGGDDAGVDEQFKPVRGFVEFLKAVADLGGELCFGTSSFRLPIVCTDGGSGSKGLLAEHTSLICLRQLGEHPNDRHCEDLGAFCQVDWV